jgi:hypothetical protein
MKHSSKKIIISILASFLFILNANANSDALKIKIINGTYTDETVIRFLPTATKGFDGSRDGETLPIKSGKDKFILRNDPINYLRNLYCSY